MLRKTSDPLATDHVAHTDTQTPPPSAWHAVRESFAAMRREGKTRHRDIAAALHLSEGELIAAHVGLFDADQSPLQATRLQARWADIVGALEALGELMALTRNDSCVHEKTGVYHKASAQGAMGLVLGGAIDLRVFYNQWAHGFAVAELLASGSVQRSLQFFNGQGVAVHKVFARDGSDLSAFDALTERFAHDAQVPGLAIVESSAAPAERPDAAIDAATFREDWISMRDTHEFFGLLKRHSVTRTQALRLAPPGYAQTVDASSAHQVLSRAAQVGVPIMVFVGNPGMIQIHSGTVHRVEVMGPWLNVLDAGFNLHLREDHIAAAWLVRKPTSDGIVSSLELFDANGETIAMFFGERKPGRSELCEWRDLLAGLTSEAQPCPV